MMNRESLLEGIDPGGRSTTKIRRIKSNGFRKKALYLKLTGRIAGYSIVALFLFFPASLFSQKTTVLDSLEKALHTAKDDTGKVDLLNKLGREFASKDLEKALQYENEALYLAERINDKKGRATAYRYQGIIYNFQGKVNEALYSYQEALNIYEETGNKKGIADIYFNVGNAYYESGKIPKMLENLKAALKIFEEIGDKKGIANVKNSFGVLNDDSGNYPEAIKNYLDALAMFDEMGDKLGISNVYNNIGSIYYNMGKYSDALKNYQAALKITEEIGDKLKLAILYNNFGLVYFKEKNYNEALKNHFASLKIKQELGNRSGIGSSYLNIGNAYAQQGNNAQALKYLKDALIISEELNEKTGLYIAYINIGLVSAKLEANDTILKTNPTFSDTYMYLNKALVLAKELDHKKNIGSIYKYLSDFDSAVGNYKQALMNFRQSVIYNDSVINDESNNQVEKLKIQYESEKKDKEIDLLNKENSIKALQMEQQKVSLLASKFELENNHNEILLLNKSNELQHLQLAKTQEDRDHQLLEVKAKTAGMDLIKKEKELKIQQLKEQKLLRNGILAGMIFLVILGFLLFRSWKLRKKLEKQQAIIQERKRISADLHDDIGSGLSKISLLSEMVKQQARSTEARKEAEKIANTARELLDSIREIIWALNANNDYLENLVAFIRKNAAEYFENSTVRLTINTPQNIPQIPISGEYRRNIFYSVKEAMHNIIKHAAATEAEVKFTLEDGVFIISIKDNGKGFPEGELNRFGNGIKNIMSRMETIHGNVTIENHVGTKITLVLPV